MRRWRSTSPTPALDSRACDDLLPVRARVILTMFRPLKARSATDRWAHLTIRGLLAAGLLVAAAAFADIGPGGPLDLRHCGGAWCGRLERALDSAGDVPGTIAISFELIPQRDPTRANAGTIVAVEGGPGYPTRGSRYDFEALFEPLLEDRHLLLMDNRGTGESGALRCRALQRNPLYSADDIEACGQQLGPAAALFGSALAADDLAALIDALELGPVDLYGDSYGTFFAQVFAGRHPERLRRMVLDGAFAARGGDPWYPEATAQANAGFDAVCARDPVCAARGGTSSARIAALLASLRTAPAGGIAPDGDGRRRHVTADARALAFVMLSNASGPVVYRDLDAAARAWSAGDRAPLLRLVAENETGAASAGSRTTSRQFSSALFVAVSCADYPQIFDATLPASERAAAADAAIDAKRRDEPDVYAPFTIDEMLSLPQDYSVVRLCVPWPTPPAAHPPGQPVPPEADFPAIPVLVLSGELDSLTPAAQAERAAALFPAGRALVVRNSFHVTALGDLDGCASELVRRFLATGDAGDTSCTERVPAYRLVADFARRAADLPPATAAPGHEGDDADLRRMNAALHTVADVVARWWVNYDGSGAGLRGGRFHVTSTADGARFRLRNVRWTEDLEVSGRIDWRIATDDVQAELVLRGAGLGAGTLSVAWSGRAPGVTARASGRFDGRPVAATAPAP